MLRSPRTVYTPQVYIDPWQPPESAEIALRDPVLRAEQAGLGVMRPALESDGYDGGLAATGAMAAAVAAMLSPSEIARVWARAEEESAKASRRKWLAEAKTAGILDRVNDPNLSARESKRWRLENGDRYAALRDEVKRQTDAHLRRARAANIGAAVVLADLLTNGLPTRHGRMRGRGTIIAGDQLHGLAGLLAQTQQRDAGLDSFIWTTRKDSRVRDSHSSLEGVEFLWSKPPSIGYPGEPINCRCRAVGIV
jgi:SPP1 gp7 family putative phage head morphogenesis protein